jgi:hypothetical protein
VVVHRLALGVVEAGQKAHGLSARFSKDARS